MATKGERQDARETLRDVVEREMMYGFMDTDISESAFYAACDAEIARREARAHRVPKNRPADCDMRRVALRVRLCHAIEGGAKMTRIAEATGIPVKSLYFFHRRGVMGRTKCGSLEEFLSRGNGTNGTNGTDGTGKIVDSN
jgi:hypothetical protein